MDKNNLPASFSVAQAKGLDVTQPPFAPAARPNAGNKDDMPTKMNLFWHVLIILLSVAAALYFVIFDKGIERWGTIFLLLASSYLTAVEFRKKIQAFNSSESVSK